MLFNGIGEKSAKQLLSLAFLKRITLMAKSTIKTASIIIDIEEGIRVTKELTCGWIK